MSEIELKINGENKIIVSDNIEQLLKELSLADKKVAVELNKEIVSRTSYSQTSLKNGDILEIISFVGGG